MKELNRKIILAERPPHEFEDVQEYFNLPFNKRLRSYLVLDTLDEGLLVSNLKYLEKKCELDIALLKSDYPGLNYASVPSGRLNIIPKSNKIIAVMSDSLNPYHFKNIVINLRKTVFFDDKVKIYFSDFCSQYFKEIINVGSVVTILNSDGSYNTYYVKEKLESDFIGIQLNYDSTSGLSATNSEICVPYDSRYDFIANNKDYSSYVASLIDEQKVKLLKSNW